MQYGKEPSYPTIRNTHQDVLKLVFTGLIIFITSACTVNNTERAGLESNTTEQNTAAHSAHTSRDQTPNNTNESSDKTVGSNPPADLWEHIANNLVLTLPENQARLEQKKQWYLKHPNYIRTITKRARPFLHHIVERFEDENIPLDIVLLPIVESAFNPYVYSSRGAAGMWQFMPATGQRFNMRQNFWYDGRKDVIASTEGAIDYLQYLHMMFDGNWLHALAAYNSGEGRVLKAIRKNEKAGLSTDFWSLDLPKETQAYVPRLLALSYILQNRKALQYEWPAIANAPAIEVVDVGSQIDLSIAAKFANISVDALRALNPGFKEWATDPAGEHQLVLPVEKTEAFVLALQNLPENERLMFYRYKVKSGDNIGLLAQSYNTTIDALKRVNDIKGNTIYIGDILLIPAELVPTDVASPKSKLSNDQAKLAYKNTQEQDKAQIKQYYTVRSGDTLSEIAQIFNVSVKQLTSWNQMTSQSTLSIGKRLTILSNESLSNESSLANKKELTYKVRSGDSLSVIAHQFNVRVKDILRWNAISQREVLQIGQPLKLLLSI